MLSLEKKLENFHGLFDNVLELRRYEKNFLLHAGPDNQGKVLFYIKNIEQDINKLGENISQVVGNTDLQKFRNDLHSYKAIFQRSSQGIPVNPQLAGIKGKALVNFVNRLLPIKQTQIRHELKLIFYSYIALTCLFFFVILLLFMMQVKSILQRMSFLQQAIHDLANNSFTPISDPIGEKDEVSELFQAFNKMAGELNTRQDQLIQSRKLAAIGAFSSGIAHELNNPLNNISLSADTLLEEYNALDARDAEEILDDIMVQTDRASKIVKKLLDFSRDKAPETIRLSIKEVINSTIDLIANQLKINAVRVEKDILADLPEINGDLQKLQQVFLNIFLNAIQVMPGGGLIHIEALKEPEGYIRINVSDTGGGIAPEHRERIFDPFYTTKEAGKGTGLGLWIVYGIIKKHGGYIEVKSKINIGSTFSVYLPFTDQTEG